MTEFGGKLLEEITETFTKKLERDKQLKVISNRVRGGTDYGIADRYSVRIGELLSESIMENTKTLPYMSAEVAREVLTPLLAADHDLIVAATNTVQENMNRLQGIGVGIQTPDLDTNRIDGFIEKVASYAVYDDAKWVLEEPIVNYSQAIVDQAMRKNMRQANSLGFRPQIRRTVGAYEVRQRKITRKLKSGSRTYTYPFVVPCKWCAELAGTYDYTEVRAPGSDVFRRHEYCRCEVTYINNGKYQDVWSKAEWTTDNAQERARAINAAVRRQESDAKVREAERVERISAVETLQRELGYSARGAAITYNKYKDLINKNGLDWFIEATRRENPLARQSRRA